MTRIIYGVCGEGGGHASRSKEVIAHLKKEGHKILCITYRKAYDFLKDYVKCYKISGLNISFKNNEADYAQTAINYIKELPDRIETFVNLSDTIKKFKPQFAITDFEPTTVTLANLFGIPLVSIDNQHRITNAIVKVPKKYESEKTIADMIVRAMVNNSIACLVISFHPAKVINPKTYIFPPILRSEIFKLKPKKKNYVLVYQTTSTNQALIDMLKGINENFVVYGFNLSKKDKNLVFKQRNEKQFLKDLENCKAVITNGGFTLISEALYLHKPVLSIPIEGQFEQILNAVYLKKLGYGEFYEKLDQGKVKNFLKHLKKYETKLKNYQREDNSKLLKKLDKLIEQHSLD